MRYLRYMSRGTSRTTGFSIGPDCVLHSSFAPHSDLVTLSINKWFSVNLLDEPIDEVSTTPSRSSPSFHHVTEGLGLPVNQLCMWLPLNWLSTHNLYEYCSQNLIIQNDDDNIRVHQTILIRNYALMIKLKRAKIASYLQTLDISGQDCNPRERDRPPPLPLVLEHRISQAYLVALKESNMMV